jgi:nitroreductase
MEVEQAVGRLRVVRHFSSEPIADADMQAILDAGRHAGSSKNLQPWHFIVVRDRQRLEALSGSGPTAGHLAGAAVGVALVTPDPHAPGAPLAITWDSGRAAQNMLLVAWERGIGSVPATVYDQQLCREILGYPVDQHCEYILSFGYPAAARLIDRPPRSGGRLPLGELVYHEHWGVGDT